MSGNYEGFAALQTPEDLLGKLQRDFEALTSDRYQTDRLFNFFVTALHMLDWIYPDTVDGNRKKRRAVTEDNVLIQICSHIANGAKHFAATDPRHESVSKVRPGGLLLANPQSETGLRFADPRIPITVELDGEAKDLYGESIKATDLAKHILDFWVNYLNKNNPS